MNSNLPSPYLENLRSAVKLDHLFCIIILEGGGNNTLETLNLLRYITCTKNTSLSHSITQMNMHMLLLQDTFMISTSIYILNV